MNETANTPRILPSSCNTLGIEWLHYILQNTLATWHCLLPATLGIHLIQYVIRSRNMNCVNTFCSLIFSKVKYFICQTFECQAG